ncbi:hypothetical protein, partial [Paracoccus sp. (in: a-proteobacteria)]|uniref:hypothetical protein n=1 Tax=Paracoccus sp. TaxID=267 RepID=UPI0026DF1F88
GTTELLDALHASGEVYHISHSVALDESPQGRAARAANESGVISDGDWLIWLDADEFLNVHCGHGMVEDLISALGPASGMLIPWRIFGDGGNKTFPERFISESFIKAADRDFSGNKIIKTFYRHHNRKIRLSEIANHRPHLRKWKHFKSTDFLNASGNILNAEFYPTARWLIGVQGKANFRIPPEDYAWELAQINHYLVRTRDMYELKAMRGRGFVNIEKNVVKRKPRHTPKFFDEHNRNEVEDRSILRHEQSTMAEMKRLLSSPAIKSANDVTLRLTQERIASLRTAAEHATPTNSGH